MAYLPSSRLPLSLYSLSLSLSLSISLPLPVSLSAPRVYNAANCPFVPPPAPLSSPAALPLAVSIRGAPAPRRTPMRLTPPSRTGDKQDCKPPAAASWSRRRMCAGEEQPISSKPTTGTAPAPSVITRYLPGPAPRIIVSRRAGTQVPVSKLNSSLPLISRRVLLQHRALRGTEMCVSDRVGPR